jgi:hypothetical protein
LNSNDTRGKTLKPINKDPKKSKLIISKRPGFSQKKETPQLHDKQKENPQTEQKPQTGYSPYAWTFMLGFPKRPPGRISKTLSGMGKAAYAVSDFFVGIVEYGSLLYNLIRYPDFIRNVLSGTFPGSQEHRKDEEKNSTKSKTGN